MRKSVALFGFVYGCTTSLLSSGWFVLAAVGAPTRDLNPTIAAVVALIHGCVLVITFHREPFGNPWRPVLLVTERRVKAAKVLLGAVLIAFILCFAVVLFAALRSALSTYDRGLHLVVASLAVLSSVYIALHWAFRPENLFSHALLQTAAFPLRIFFRHRDPSKRLH